VWYSNQQPVHCAFSLQRHSASTTQLSCKISVRQVKGHEQLLQVYSSVGEVRFTQMASLSPFTQLHVNFFPVDHKKMSLPNIDAAYCNRLSCSQKNIYWFFNFTVAAHKSICCLLYTLKIKGCLLASMVQWRNILTSKETHCAKSGKGFYKFIKMKKRKH